MENKQQKEIDFDTVARNLFQTAETTWVEKTLERLYNSPEALNALGLCKWSNDLSYAMKVESLRRISGAGLMDCKEALVSADWDGETALMALRTKGLAVAIRWAGYEKLEAELNEVKQQLKAVREMRDRLMVRLKLINSRATLAGTPINDKMDMLITEEVAGSHLLIAEAEAQKAKEQGV